MSEMFCLPNLTAQTVTKSLPWEFECIIPEEVRKNKDERVRWITSEFTQHCVYSAVEGNVPTVRVSKDNQPKKIHYLIADFDASMDDDDLQKGLDRCGKMLPRYVERTLSGNGRFIWELEKPILTVSMEHATAILAHARVKLKMDRVLAGFDAPAWDDPAKYYTTSGYWIAVDEAKPIPADTSMSWVFQASKKANWDELGDVRPPMEAIKAAIEEKFPGRWQGDVREGARGVTFWNDNADNASAAIIFSTGVYSFTDQEKPFRSWADIFGDEWVEKFKKDRIAQAIQDVWFDGMKYWKRDGAGFWQPYACEDTKRFFNVRFFLSKKGSPNEVDQAIVHIQDFQGINAAAPFACRPSGIIDVDGERYINTYRRMACQPLDTPQAWGSGGGFPWISAFLDNAFNPRDQLWWFLAHTKRFYESCLYCRPAAGQIVLIAGPAGTGKTLLTNRLIAGMMGGRADAVAYAVEGANFNEELFDVPVWCIDDSTPATGRGQHSKFSAILKRTAANQLFHYHAKFRKPVTVEWRGRMYMTCNEDPESLRMAPDTDGSLLDKLMMFRFSNYKHNFFRSGMNEHIASETPAFCRWILDWATPEHVVGDARYGIKSYHEKTLFTTTQQSSSTGMFAELLEMFKIWFFGVSERDEWVGTASELLQQMAERDGMDMLLKNYSSDGVSRGLSKLHSQGFDVMPVPGRTRRWRITRGDIPNPRDERGKGKK